jgi:hypothetical protein
MLSAALIHSPVSLSDIFTVPSSIGTLLEKGQPDNKIIIANRPIVTDAFWN